MDEKIRQILAQNGRLSVDALSIRADDDLYQAGMTSHANVNVMMALEEAYDIEFPPEMLRRSTFESIDAISGAIATLTAAGVAK
jgi:acyl carrier protein